MLRPLVSLVMLATSGGAAQAGSVEALALTGIAHVALRVTNVSASRAFYEKLGFEQAFAFTDAQGVATSYIKVNDRQFIELYRRQTESDAPGLMHLCFDVSDINRLRAEYLQRGLQPAEALKARAGNLLFTLRDPEGQLLEYTQYLPGSLHTNPRGQFQSQRRLSDHLIAAAVPVKDLAAERAFYSSQLGFEVGGAAARLEIPGACGEAIELEPAPSSGKPRIEFAVVNIQSAAAELRSRGLSSRRSGETVLATDPDGTSIIFTLSTLRRQPCSPNSRPTPSSRP